MTDTPAVANDASRPDPIESVSKRITQIVAIIATVAGINTGVTSCSEQTVIRYDRFRTAFNSEEEFWRGLYAEYAKLVDAESQDGANDAVIEARKFGLVAASERPAHDFREFQLAVWQPSWAGEDDTRTQAADHVARLRTRLIAVLGRDQTVGSVVQVQEFALASVSQSQRAETRQEGVVSTVAQEKSVAAVATGAVASTLGTVTLSAGNPAGFDHDVFWCRGGTPEQESVRQAFALSRAQVIASAAGAKETLAGQKIGRVRLRPLPEALQGKGFPIMGSPMQVRYDSNSKVEAAVAQNLAAKLSTATVKFETKPSYSSTRYYLSTFVCQDAAPGIAAVAAG